MEEPFTKVVSHIFNNWTGLRLAVDHSMGGPNSKQTALEFMNYMVQYCLYESNVEVDSIQEALEDVLDQEFETICEDDSTRQIACLLYNFLSLLKQGKFEECELEFQKLPTINTDWLNQQTQARNRTEATASDDSSDSDNDDTASEPPTLMEDDGWTQVKGRKKR